MASAGGDDFDDFGDKLVRKKSDDTEKLTPDTEENVVQQSEGVFRNFIHTRYESEQLRSPELLAETPCIPELTNFTEEPMSRTSEIGRQLAQIGDDINARYANHFNQMISTLHITPDTAYEAFAGVARKLFAGGINWGRIVTLLCFGYRIALVVLEKGLHSFFEKIIKFVVTFIAKEKIAAWIAKQGGWVAALRYVPETVGWPAFVAVSMLACLTVFVVYKMSKQS